MASLDSGSKKFKTQNLNSLFLAESEAKDEPKEKNNPGPAYQRRTSLATARGTYRLTAMKEDTKDNGWVDDKTPEPGAKPATASPAAHSTNPTTSPASGAAPSHSKSDPPQPRSRSQSPPASSAEKSTAASSGFEMGNEPFNWDEEDDNWQPPTVSSAQVISQVSGAAPSPSPKVKSPEPAPWLQKKPSTSAHKSLQERIAELKMSKSSNAPAHPRHGGHGDHRHNYPTYAHPPQLSHSQHPGVDSLSRFRIRGDPAELDARHPPRYGRHGHHDEFAHHGRSDRGYRDPLDEIDSWRRPAREPPTSDGLAPWARFRPSPSGPGPSGGPSAASAGPALAATPSTPAVSTVPTASATREQAPAPAAAAAVTRTTETNAPAPASSSGPAPVAPWAFMRKKEQEEVMRDARLRLQARKDAEEAERKERAARLQARLDELALKKAEKEAQEQKEAAALERKRMEEERRARSAKLEQEFAEKLRIENEKAARKLHQSHEHPNRIPNKRAVPKGNPTEPLPPREDIPPFLRQFLRGAPEPGPGFGGFDRSRLGQSNLPADLPLYESYLEDLSFGTWPEPDKEATSEPETEEAPIVNLPKLQRFTFTMFKKDVRPLAVDSFMLSSSNCVVSAHTMIGVPGNDLVRDYRLTLLHAEPLSKMARRRRGY